MTDIIVGSVSVSVTPDARGWEERSRQQIVEPSRTVGDEAGQVMGDAITEKMGESGDKAGSAFEKTLKARLRVAMDTLPKANIEGDTTELDLKLDEIRLKIASIRDQDLIDPRKTAVDVEEVMGEIVSLQVWAKTQKVEIPVEAQIDMGKTLKALSSIRGVGPTGATTGGLLSGLSGDVSGLSKEVTHLSTAATSVADTVSSLTGAGGTVQDIVKSTTESSQIVANLMKDIVTPKSVMPTSMMAMRSALAYGRGDVMSIAQNQAKQMMEALLSEFGLQRGMSSSIMSMRSALGFGGTGATMTLGEGQVIKDAIAAANVSKGMMDSIRQMDEASRNLSTFGNVLKSIGWTSGKSVLRNIANVSGIDLIPGGTKFANAVIKFDDTVRKIPSYLKGAASDAFGSILKSIGWTSGAGVSAVRNIANVSGIDLIPGGTKFANALITFAESHRLSTDVFKNAAKEFSNSVRSFGSDVANWSRTVSTFIGSVTGAIGRFTGAVGNIFGIAGKYTGLSWAGRTLGGGLSSLFGRGAADVVNPQDIATLEKLLGSKGGGGTLGKLISSRGGAASFLEAFGGDTSALFKRMGIVSAAQTEKDIAAAVALAGTKGLGADVIKAIGGGGGGGDIETALRDFAGGGGDIGKILETLGGAGGGGAGGGGIMSKLGGFGSGALSLIGGPQALAVGGGIAAIAPFVGQLFAGGAVGGLGSALGGMGLMGAVMSGKLTKQLSSVSAEFGNFMRAIGGPMIPVLHDTLVTIASTLRVMTPVFKTAEGIIAKATTPFFEAIIKSFGSPAVSNAVKAIASAFASILKAVTPEVGPAMNMIANSITDMAKTVASNPQAMANVFTYIMDFVNFMIRAVDDLAKVANIIEKWQGGLIGKILGDTASGIGKGIDAFGKIEKNVLGIGTAGDRFALGLIQGKGVGASATAAVSQVTNNFRSLTDYLGFTSPGGGRRSPIHHTVIHTTDSGFRAGFRHSILTGQGAVDVIAPIGRRVHPPDFISSGFRPGIRHSILTGPDVAAPAAASAYVARGPAIVKAVEISNHAIAASFDWLRHETSHIWDVIWADSMGKVVHMFSEISGWIAAHFDVWWKTHGESIEIIWRAIWTTATQYFNVFFVVPIRITMSIVDKIISMAFTRIRATVNTGMNVIKGIIKFSMDWIKGSWQGYWHAIEAFGKLIWDDIRISLKLWWDLIVGIFDIAIDLLTGHWATAWNDLKTTAVQLWNNILTWFTSIENDLWQVGVGIINGLKGGIKATMQDVATWGYDDIVKPILNFLLSPAGFHISSPSKKTEPIGKHLVEGIIQGMLKEGKNIGKFVERVFGSWPNAVMSFISKGLSITKLPMKTLEMIFGKGTALFKFLFGSGGGATGPAGVGSSAGEMANGRQLYNYLLKNVFAGNKIAAAGATASIWGESNWNPFAQGTGGRGLIGWTPAGTISDAAFKGGMATQLPAIIRFINTSGDWGVINQMKGAKSVIDAAYMWGKGVERYGIPDVHPTGVQLASSFMDQGGWLPPGASLVYNMTGKPELVLTPDQIAASMGTQYHAHFDGLTGTAIQSHVRTAFHLMSMTEGNLSRPGRRS